MRLKAINPIDHNGKRYDADSKPFEVADEDQAQALIDCGAAAEVQGETAAEKKAREKHATDLAAAHKVLNDPKSKTDDKAAAQKIIDGANE